MLTFSSLRGRIIFVVGLLTFVGLIILTVTNMLVAKHHSLQSLNAQTKALARSHAGGFETGKNCRGCGHRVCGLS